jgi:hypothetical protein
VSRNLPALSFLSARHVVSPLRVKLKKVCANREIFGCFVKGEMAQKQIKVCKKSPRLGPVYPVGLVPPDLFGVLGVAF